MYAEFYGLKELPFALTPDPRFIYFTPSHTEVMANLHYGIESGKGLIVVTGEVGTGKTTILRWMMQRLDRTVLVAYVFNPRLSVTEFYQHVASLLDVQKWETKPELLVALGGADRRLGDDERERAGALDRVLQVVTPAAGRRDVLEVDPDVLLPPLELGG